MLRNYSGGGPSEYLSKIFEISWLLFLNLKIRSAVEEFQLVENKELKITEAAELGVNLGSVIISSIRASDYMVLISPSIYGH